MGKKSITGKVTKPICNWREVVHEVGKKVAIRHWRRDYGTCTVENLDGTNTCVGVPIDRIKLDSKDCF